MYTRVARHRPAPFHDAGLRSGAVVDPFDAPPAWLLVTFAPDLRRGTTDGSLEIDGRSDSAARGQEDSSLLAAR